MTPIETIRATCAAIRGATTAEAKAEALAEGLALYEECDFNGGEPIGGGSDMTAMADCAGEYGAAVAFGFVGDDGVVHLVSLGHGRWGTEILDTDYWRVDGDEIVAA